MLYRDIEEVEGCVYAALEQLGILHTVSFADVENMTPGETKRMISYRTAFMSGGTGAARDLRKVVSI